MDRNELIWEYQRSIIEIYNEHQLTSLRGLDGEYKVNGRQIMEWYKKAIEKSETKNIGKFNYCKNFDDIIFCSDELLYFTAHLFMYRPFINNPIKDRQLFYGQDVYPNFQSLEAKRYNMFTDITSQIAYNYWDRIGDLIASFFPELIKPREVFFPTAIEAIPLCFQSNENYLWLKDFKEKGYVSLNKKRKRTVHYQTTDTDFMYNHNDKISNREALQTLQDERNSLADFYQEHISLTMTGFEKTLFFIEDINHMLFE